MNIFKPVQTFLRTFFLQGFWNYAQMQNIGMLFILLPSLKRIYKGDKEGLKRAIARNMEAFNSQPVMSAYSIGAMIQQEQKIAAALPFARPEEEREYRIIRVSAANTAASIGDRLFWATLKPLSLVVFFVILFGGETQVFGEELPLHNIIFTVSFALIGSLLIYNVPAFVTRFKGLIDSYSGSENDFYGLIKINWNKLLYFLKTLGQIFTVFVIFYGLYIKFRGSAADIDSVTRLSLLAAFIVLGIVMKKLNMPGIILYIAATGVFVAASLLA